MTMTKKKTLVQNTLALITDASLAKKGRYDATCIAMTLLTHTRQEVSNNGPATGMTLDSANLVSDLHMCQKAGKQRSAPAQGGKCASLTTMAAMQKASRLLISLVRIRIICERMLCLHGMLLFHAFVSYVNELLACCSFTHCCSFTPGWHWPTELQSVLQG